MKVKIELVDITTILPSVTIDLKYATDDNLTLKKIYTEPRCLLRQEAAEALSKSVQIAQQAGYTLLIFDAYRPQFAQECLFNACPNPEYIVDPKIGSNHTRGVAVDLTLLQQGKALDMGSAFDEMTELSHFLSPEIPPHLFRNRLLLNAIMCASGFIGIASEWWHFELPDAFSYPLLPNYLTV